MFDTIDSERYWAAAPSKRLALGAKLCQSSIHEDTSRLKQYQGRNPNGYFQDLDWPVRQRAWDWLGRLCAKGKRERGSVPQWLFALYVGQAKRLAPEFRQATKWSRWMNAKKGGYAVRRTKVWAEGRHPTEKATYARLAALNVRREAERRKRLGLPPASRHGFTVLIRHEP